MASGASSDCRFGCIGFRTFRKFAFSLGRESGGLWGLRHDELGGRCWERLVSTKVLGGG